MSHKTVEVPNISCGHCVKTIEREVAALPGITTVAADQGTREVSVEWDEAVTEWGAVDTLLREIHYPPAT